MPEAGCIAEISSLLAAARAEVGQLLETLGYLHPMHPRYLATGEPRFAQSFSGDLKWATAHHDKAITVLRMAAASAPPIVIQTARSAYHLGNGAASATIRRIPKRMAVRLDEVRSLADGY